LLLCEHRTPGAQILEQLGHVGGRERSDVDAVDGGHRRDVAGAETLKGAHVDRFPVDALGGGCTHDLIELIGAAQRAGDVRADIHAVAAHGARLEHVVEARDGLQVGGREAHHARDLLDRLGRAPAVQTLRGCQRRQGGGAVVGVVGHVALDL